MSKNFLCTGKNYSYAALEHAVFYGLFLRLISFPPIAGEGMKVRLVDKEAPKIFDFCTSPITDHLWQLTE